ncbi:MAG: excinuclease ABC subunit UvrA [Prevotellaceae bacterium]|jgi:excinuclease ABC subunit A|nr:excinuclease ABC subunit UvrA [Prevotellaceae bacterium]
MSDSKYISIKGARVHNLKNINLEIPRGKLVVITGLSGSGKSTLAFDTIFAEGQRRYVESLSSYARQFLGRISKPEVDFIEGIPPAIAIEQKVNTRNPRSTVGTSTEIYDYLKLLYARIGKTFSPVSGKEVKIHSVTDVVDFIVSRPEGERMLILAPLHLSAKENLAARLTTLVEQGFSRIEVNRELEQIANALPKLDKLKKSEVFLVIDRISAAADGESQARFADSVQTAFNEGDEECIISLFDPLKGTKQTRFEFSTRYEMDGIMFEEPTEHLFSFNNPLGACPVCDGYGKIIGIDEDLVVPDRSLSVYNNAIACWKGDTMSAFKNKLIAVADKFDFPIHRPYSQLSDNERELLWNGNRYFTGIHEFFRMLEKEKYKIQYRVLISRYTGKTICPECKGSRLRKEAGYVKINRQSISDLMLLPIDKLPQFFNELQLDKHDTRIAGRALVEVKNRLQFLLDVGLSYLTLNRLSSTLSGGESQRINLATSLGSSLVGSLYILDEPSIGLHPRDTNQLIKVLKQLRDLGNTVLLVEHEEEIIRAADEIVDIGPLAGRFGGEVVFHGVVPENIPKINADTRKKSEKKKNEEEKVSLTLQYLSGEEFIAVPKQRRKLNRYVEIRGARENNLKGIDVKIPLNGIVAVTGVSGSGKSSLVKSILFPALNRLINQYGEKAGKFDDIKGDIKLLKGIEMVDQNPIGRSSRSNPVTYIKAYDEIRKLFSEQPYAKQNGYTPSYFSFNIDGGRCEECQGDGFIKMEMQFMSDVTLVCESCGGKRFKQDILDVKYKDLNISDVLDLSVAEAIEFFGTKKESLTKKIAERLQPLQDVGLDYVKLGQASSTLSGGESQRVKLAYFLSKENTDQHTLFIFDEPTTGLHFHDIRKLMAALNALVDRGNSVVLVEHNMDVIKSADWVIDIGPEGGEKGGSLIFEGTPEELAKCKESYTGQYLKEKLPEK